VRHVLGDLWSPNPAEWEGLEVEQVVLGKVNGHLPSQQELTW
jgi:hypothetical protein